MTNRNEIASILSAAIDAYADSPYTSDEPLFHLTIEILIAANRELTNALPNSDDHETYRYYFSDSTYDDYNNPTMLIAECNAILNCLYEIPDELRAAFATMPDNIEYLLSYELDDIQFNSLSDIIAHFRAMNRA
jgi:hypothetical protein